MKILKDAVYIKSNQIEILPSKVSKTSQRIYKKLISSASLTQSGLQDLTTSICKDFGVCSVSVSYSGREPHSTRGGRLRIKVHGTYTVGRGNIRIYKYTAKQGKVRAVKSTLDTLLHEICHHLDFEFLKLSDSLHTSGFYKRISCLKKQLEG